MYNCNSELNNFYDVFVRLSEEEKSKLRDFRDKNLERVKEGIDKLNEEEDEDYPKYVNNIDQGSMAMHTINQSQHSDDQDIDHALIFEKDEIDSDPAEVKNIIAKALNKSAINFKKAPEARTNAVTVWYQDGYHVDFAIYRRSEDWLGNVILEHAGESWTKRNPSSITDWFNEKNLKLSPSRSTDKSVTVKDGQLRRVVRLFKYWSKSRSGWSLPGGLILTVLVVECFVLNKERDDVSFFETLKAIKARLGYNVDVRNPVDSSKSLVEKDVHTKQVKSLKSKLESWLPTLNTLLDANLSEDSAKKAWGKFFKNSWWSEEVKKAVAMRSLNNAVARTDILNVSVIVHNPKTGRKYPYSPDSTQTVAKGVHLEFQAMTSLSGAYQVEWEVQNAGDEAEWDDQVDPRPGLVDDFNFHHCKEKTAFRGDHLMICKLLKGRETIVTKEIEVRVR